VNVACHSIAIGLYIVIGRSSAATSGLSTVAVLMPISRIPPSALEKPDRALAILFLSSFVSLFPASPAVVLSSR
jgi:hypothetical protein